VRVLKGAVLKGEKVEWGAKQSPGGGWRRKSQLPSVLDVATVVASESCTDQLVQLVDDLNTHLTTAV